MSVCSFLISQKNNGSIEIKERGGEGKEGSRFIDVGSRLDLRF
jgi:hypothetical protein